MLDVGQLQDDLALSPLSGSRTKYFSRCELVISYGTRKRAIPMLHSVRVETDESVVGRARFLTEPFAFKRDDERLRREQRTEEREGLAGEGLKDKKRLVLTLSICMHCIRASFCSPLLSCVHFNKEGNICFHWSASSSSSQIITSGHLPPIERRRVALFITHLTMCQPTRVPTSLDE